MGHCVGRRDLLYLKVKEPIFSYPVPTPMTERMGFVIFKSLKRFKNQTQLRSCMEISTRIYFSKTNFHYISISK